MNGRTVIVHMGDGEANATVDGTHFNVRSLWQLSRVAETARVASLIFRCGAALVTGARAGDLKTDNVGKCLQFAVDDLQD